MSVVARFEMRYTQFLDEQGRATQESPAFARDTAALVDLYRWMVLMRTFDVKAVALQRTGQLGTYAPIVARIENRKIERLFSLSPTNYMVRPGAVKGAVSTKNSPLSMTIRTLHRRSLYPDAV